ncbi:insulinase family protein [Paenibacillus sp. FSL P4-0338]|uniref:insulinase family protein n=1 Tax=unclassified Paenibacillus TaxID=185978 RepID=UPI0003E2BAD9|nr:insulinase family protein [Paenibacillus sp. FSL R7-269]ETT32270.1 putative zinc protease [Paenibacillus sp. FSL R7-269]
MKEGCLYLDNYLNLDYVHFRKEAKAQDAIITLAVKVGSVDDRECKGIAHYLEHMLILSLANASQIAPGPFRIKGTTDFDKTLYEITCSDNTDDICQAIKLLLEIYSGRLLKKSDMEEAYRDINEEYERLNENNPHNLFKILMDNSELIDSLPLGTRDCLDDITYEEMQAFHQRTYCRALAHILVVSWSNDEKLRQCCRDNMETIRTVKRFQPLNEERQAPMYSAVANKYVFRTVEATKCSLFVYEAQTGSEDRSRGKVVKDIGLVVLDYCLRIIFSTDAIYVAKLRYNEFYTFLCIYFPMSINLESGLYTNQIFRFIYRETISLLAANDLLPEIIKAYRNQIMENELTRELIMKELISSALYHEPIYAMKEYCSILNEVSCELVLEQISAWLNQGEEIAVVVDEAWLNGSMYAILG